MINTLTSQHTHSQLHQDTTCELHKKRPSSSDLLPPNVLTNFHLLSPSAQTTYYIVYDAISVADNQNYCIRALDIQSDFYLKDRSLALKYFMEELSYLCMRFDSEEKVADFSNLVVDDDRVALVMKPCATLRHLKQQGVAIDVEKMLKEVYSDICLISSRFGIHNLDLNMDTIFCSNECYFISDFATGTLINRNTWAIAKKTPKDQKNTRWAIHQLKHRRYLSPEQLNSKLSELPKDTSIEIYNLGLLCLELAGIEASDWEILPLEEDENHYAELLKIILQKLQKLKQSNSLLSLLNLMLAKDVPTRLIAKGILLLNESTQSTPSNHEHIIIQTIEKPKETLTIDFETIKDFTKLPKKKKGSKATPTAEKHVIQFETKCQLTENDLDELGLNITDVVKLWMPGLKAVRFRELEIDVSKAKILSESLFWPNLESLDLAENNIGDQGVKFLAENKTWVNLRSLNLSKNKIHAEGCEYLAKNETWPELRDLYLQYNDIGAKGAQNLAQNTTWTHLTSLQLTACNIGVAGAKSLVSNKKWLGLAFLGLLQNNVDQNTADYIKATAPWGHQVSISF